MEKRNITIEESAVFPLTQEIFADSCGFQTESDIHRKMTEDALHVREKLLKNLTIRGVLGFAETFLLQGNRLIVEDMEFQCDRFRNISSENVEGIYLYMLTAGACTTGDGNQDILTSVYEDIWGNSYVEAGFRYLINQFMMQDMKRRFPDQRVYLSFGYGPGYFDMPLMDTKKLYELLDGRDIQVTVSDHGLILPTKSRAGMFFLYNQEESEKESHCAACGKRSIGCQWCTVKKGVEVRT